MALALLFSLLRARDPNIVIGDNPCGGAHAFVVDHKMRPESKNESLAVVTELSKLDHIDAHRLELNWGRDDPASIKGIETAARRLRYRALGSACVTYGVDALLLGHHADDVHETVLMRLLRGQSGRGLRGTEPFNDIPECDGLHGLHKSGFLDIMRTNTPPLTYKQRRRDSLSLRRRLLDDMRSELRLWGDDTLEHLRPKRRRQPDDPDMLDGVFADAAERLESPAARRASLAQLDTEEGGVRVCRPFLGFAKERLVATCEAHGVRWFEDPTNADPALTERNAVRHVLRSAEVPVALRRPAILDLAARVRARVAAEEDEADALLGSTEVLDLRTNAGTMVVELPDVQPGEDPERSRTVAGLLLRRLMSAVSPEPQPPPLTSLQGAISRLFPALATPAHPASSPPSFPAASVLFTRLPAPTPRWHLSRAPYPSTQPLPSIPLHQPKGMPNYGPMTRIKSHWAWKHRPWALFDGRFWLRLRLRLAGTVTLAPFRPEHAKAFRSALPEADYRRLEQLLLAYAPGKVRWTLPAVYYEGALDVENGVATIGGTRTLLGLPSLDVRLPGSEKFVQWDVRYKKVDAGVLARCGMEVMPVTEHVL